jgi:glycine oxidase
MSETNPVVVLGGGIAGCATAYFLARAGRAVTVVERESIGVGASGWSAGRLNPVHGVPPVMRKLALQSYRMQLELWPELSRVTGRAHGGFIADTLMVAESEEQARELHALEADLLAVEGFEARWLSGAEIAAAEPRLRPGLAGGQAIRGVGVIDSLVLTELFAEAARAHGAMTISGEVQGVSKFGDEVTAIRVDGSVLECSAVVVAMGPWSAVVGEWLGVSIPVEPLKGEIIRLRCPWPLPPWEVITDRAELYTRYGNMIWVGSTRERKGFDREISQWGYDSLLSGAAAIFPPIVEAELMLQTVCLRPTTPDDLPIIGRVPGLTNAYVATGGGTKGILLAPAMARGVADLILDAQTVVDIASFGLARFE